MNTEDSTLELISIHVPKTAGTTFRKVLEQVYGLEAVIVDYPGEHRKRFDNQWETRKSKIKVIHGHFGVNKYEKYFPEVKQIAWIRHPIHRLISHYFFWLNQPLDKIQNSSQRFLVENQISLLEFAQLPDIRNITSRFLNRRKITDFYFVGIQEFFQEDLIYLKEQLVWSDFEIEYTNKNNHSNYEEKLQNILLDTKLIHQLEEINSDDVEFYQRALKNREERINKQNKILTKNKTNINYGENNSRLFKIQNAIVERFQIFRGRFELAGGPIFPNDIPGVFRHRRGDLRGRPKYLDKNFQSGSNNDSQIDSSILYHGRYIYGGFFNGHFGHVLTESLHRLWAFHSSDYDGIVFSVLSATPRQVSLPEYNPPKWFDEVLEVIGIPRAKCIFVSNRHIFETLVIPEPGSELLLGIKEWYRSYLESLQERILDLTHNLRKDLGELKLFIGRNHIPLNGSVAGEKYLESLLVDEGYVSFKPENYDFIEQLSYFINAKKIIFTEGSAIYHLELINYLDTEIACVPRRKHNRHFYPHINNKCHKYIVAGNVENCEELGSYKMEKGGKRISVSKRPYDIIQSLRNHNFALLKNWNESIFFTQEKSDIMSYVTQGYTILDNKKAVYCSKIIEKYLEMRKTSLEQLQENSVAPIFTLNSLELSPKSDNIDLESRSGRLNKIAIINQLSSYLEIGVSKGMTFNQINIKSKVAVDPKFRFNTTQYASENVVFLEITSDEFFIDHAKKFQPFDLIYLDGLHTFEQTFRDFCSSLSCAHAKTIWLIDDTCPGSYAQAQPSLQQCRQIQKMSGEKDGSWMGDVFKVVAAIHDFFPQYSFAHFPNHGQTVVWHKWRENFMPKWNSLEVISRLEYSDFVELQSSLFKREPYEEIFELIKPTFRTS
ncbi:MAG: glycosyltransferase 61 family protein [Trichodesmium sp. ALOHA_ZT_67]|nr:glycosyltransferase 61 family protein [Trichodesmium sp. ALOHA_ZT_67]